MKKLLSMAALAAGTAMVGVGAYGLLKSRGNNCTCNCACDDNTVAEDDVEDFDEVDSEEV